MELESNVRLLGELATDASASLDNAQNDLVVINDELAQLALQVSTLNGKSITLNTGKFMVTSILAYWFH